MQCHKKPFHNGLKLDLVSLVFIFPDTRESQSEGGKNCRATSTFPKRPLSLKNWQKAVKHLTEGKISMIEKLHLNTFMSVYEETTQWLYAKLT